MNRLRAGGRIVRLALLLLVAVPGHFLWRTFGWRSGWAQWFLRRGASAAGVDLTVVGTPVTDHALLVANHRSWLDILVLAAGSGCAFVSKAEIADWPVIGMLARINRSVFIERTKRSDARGQADTLRAAVAGGDVVGMFPEGGTNDEPGILPFKASLFASVFPPPPGVRVQPALIDYGTATAEVTWPEDESAPQNALRLLGRRGRMPVTVSFRAPLDPAAFPDRKALAAAARAALEDRRRIA